MFQHLKRNKLFWIGVVIFCIIYTCLIVVYSNHIKERNLANIERHASIMAYDVWGLNDINLNSYLNLAANADGYQTLSVISTEGDITIKTDNFSLSGLDFLFNKLGVVDVDFLSAKINYNDNIIGTITGYKYNKNIYVFLNIFIVQFIVFLFFVPLIYLSKKRKYLQKEVHEKNQKYYDLVNLLPEIVIETNKDGQVIYANKVALEQFQIAQIISPSIQCRDLLQIKNHGANQLDILTLSKRDQLLKKECIAKRIDGSSFPVLVSSSPILSKGNMNGARFVIIDITERLGLEAQLQRDQKMKSIGLMASGVAHDLNNILSGIVSYPELILINYPNEKELHRLVEPIKDSGLQAAAVVSDLLTVARGIAAVKNNININNLVNDYLLSSEFKHLQNIYPNIQLTLQLSPTINSIECSEPHVRKSLMNLLTNAAEAISGDGEITIATETRKIQNAPSIDSNLVNGQYTVLLVKDSGTGISEKHLSNIFEPFYSKKQMGRSGTGLGLTIIWNVMKDHGGAVFVKADDNETVFELYFPTCVNEISIEDEVDKGNWQMYTGNREKILVVDDEPSQRDIALQLLTVLNYDAQTAASGEEAIEILKNNNFDLLMLDMVMGDGFNGRETYEEILKNQSTQKAIVVSGFSESDDVRKTIQLGANRLLLKPYTLEALAKDIYHSLNHSTGIDEK